MQTKTLGVLLAGGKAQRFGGGDKCLRPLRGKPLLDYIVARAAPQVDQLILNANGDAVRFDSYGLEVVADVVDGFAGPLAGVLSALEWAQRHAGEIAWVVSLPTDGPLLPKDLVSRFHSAIVAEDAQLAYATSNGRAHPVVALWPVALAPQLRAALVDEDLRKVGQFIARYRAAQVDFSVSDFGPGIDPFLNINTPEDLARAEVLLD